MNGNQFFRRLVVFVRGLLPYGLPRQHSPSSQNRPAIAVEVQQPDAGESPICDA